MAPGRKRGGKQAKTKVELNLGDLVLAKIKGFPAWPAKISRPEDWEHLPDPKKHFVQFFGTSEIAFVAPADIQSFTSEVKNKLSARCQGKKVGYFAQAVREICEEFEQLQHKNSTIVRDDERTETFSSEARPSNPVVDEATEFVGNNVSDIKGPEDNLESKGLSDLAPGLEHCVQRQGEADFQQVKRSLSDGGNSDVPPSVASGKNELSTDHTNVARDSVSVSSPCPKGQSCHDSKVEGMCFDVSLRELTNGHKQNLASGSKKKPEGTMKRNCDSSAPCVKGKLASGGSMISSADTDSTLDVSGEKKESVLIKNKIDLETTNDSREDSEGNLGERNESPPRKKMNAKHGREKEKPRTNKSSLAAKMSKCADTGNGIAKLQQIRKSDSESPNALDEKNTHTKFRRSTSGSKAETRPARVLAATNVLNHSSDEDLPPPKRHCRASATMSSSALLSEDKLGNSTSRKNDLVLHTRVRSPIGLLPSKRRAVRLCDDEDDELPKTPIHGRVANNDSVIPCAAYSQEKHVMHGECSAENQHLLRNGVDDGGLEDQVKFGGVSNKPLSQAAAQQGVEQKTEESSGVHVCPSPMQLDIEELPSVEAKTVLLSPIESPPSVHVTRPSAELQSKHPCKAPGNASTKKHPARDNSNASASDRSNSIVSQSVGERRKAASGERVKTTTKSDLQINTSGLVVDTKNDSTTVGERVDVGRDDKSSFPIDSERSGSVLSMKHLIAAAQAKKKQAHSQSSHGNAFLFLFPEADMSKPGPNPFLAEVASESSKMLQLDVHSNSPCSYPNHFSSSNQHENEDHMETGRSLDHQGTIRPLSVGTEAAVARDAFEGMIETLSRTKESIGRATRLAIDCAKHGIANEVVELLIQKLEKESSLHRRVDLFFLVDSITQCSHSQRGSSYIPIVQAALPRLIGAVAPAGTSAQENRRQCRKVLRLWLERKILPESVLRHYMDVMGLANDDISGVVSQRRPSRAERAFDDPIREMEGMVVDEYGSNTTFELPGLLSINLFEEEECEDIFRKKLSNVDDDDDDDSLPTKFAPATISYPENNIDPPNDAPHRVLKDVDGELEMEDVSGHPKDEKPLFSCSSFEFASLEPNSESLPSLEGSPPLPPGSPPVTPPLPTSPPPSSSPSRPPRPPPLLSPQLPPPPPHYSQPHIFPPPPVGLAPSRLVGPPQTVGLAPPPVATHVPSVGPPLLSQQSFPPQPQFMPQHMPPLPSALSHSPQSAYHPPPPLHDVGGTPSGNQCSHVVSNTPGPAVDGCVRSDVQPQQASCIPPVVSTAREHVTYNSTRHVEYGQGDAYMNANPLQHQQQPVPGGAPLHRRPVHPELPPRGPPSHFSYQNPIRQHHHPPYSIPSFSEDPRRYAIDDQRRMQVNESNVDYPHSGWVPQGRSCSGQPYPNGGYFRPPLERPLVNTVNFQPSGPNNLPAGHFPVHGGPMIPNRPDLFGVNQ